MQLHFVPRTEYRNKTTDSFLASIIGDFGNWYVIPEGGSGPEGVEGCREIIRAGDEQFDVIVVCCGTGATAAGLISSMHPHQQLLGFSVLNDGGELEKSISGWITGGMDVRPAFQINRNFVFGGYGKTTPELDLFISAFMKNTGIPTEKVYTAKMFFGIDHMIRTGYFPEGTKILALHTGGLQYMPETNN
jgi:1-aminocyclopropane-1-carboxylate deaminase